MTDKQKKKTPKLEEIPAAERESLENGTATHLRAQLSDVPALPEPDFENDIYPCPPGWDPKYWEGYGIGNQRAYWWAIKNSQEITGGQ